MTTGHFLLLAFWFDSFRKCVSATASLIRVVAATLEGTSGTTWASFKVGIHYGKAIECSWASFFSKVVHVGIGVGAVVFIHLLLRVNRSSKTRKRRETKVRFLLVMCKSQKERETGTKNSLAYSFRHAADTRRFGLLHTSKQACENHCIAVALVYCSVEREKRLGRRPKFDVCLPIGMHKKLYCRCIHALRLLVSLMLASNSTRTASCVPGRLSTVHTYGTSRKIPENRMRHPESSSSE